MTATKKDQIKKVITARFSSSDQNALAVIAQHEQRSLSDTLRVIVREKYAAIQAEITPKKSQVQKG